MNKQQLAAKIWASANQMRKDGIDVQNYKDYILGFIFYKYLSDKEEQFLKKNDWTEDDLPELTEKNKEDAKFCRDNLGYFIAYNHLFSTWLKIGKQFNIADVRKALSAFSRNINPKYKRVYDRVFESLQTGLQELGDTAAAQTRKVIELLALIKEIPTDCKQNYDVLGFIYEYLISRFAASAGKKAGEFYTPHEVAVLMSEIVADHLKDRENIEIYDPTSGSGSLLLTIGRSVSKHISGSDNVKYYAQELIPATHNLTRMNLVMRGILPDNIETRCADTLGEDWPTEPHQANRKYMVNKPLRVDAVVSNPPYSMNWSPDSMDGDPRFAEYGLAPKTKADFAFLLHSLYHIKPDGIMTIVLPHGVLYRGGEEEEIRKNLIGNNHIDAIIGLPDKIFYGTSIATLVMVLKRKRDNTDVLFIDASKGFLPGKNNVLRASDIRKIADTVRERNLGGIEKYSAVVSRETIIKNGYNLNISRYVDSSNDKEPQDLYATMYGGIPNAEIETFRSYWDTFPTLHDELFKSLSATHSELTTEDIARTISDNADVVSYTNKFSTTFNSMPAMLCTKLIDEWNTIDIVRTQEEITVDLFQRITSLPLIDKYQSYQLFANHWTTISADLEMLQTEGWSAARQVDPNMVIRKKDGKEEEVQEGWKGHIIPFDLVQQELLKDLLDEIDGINLKLQQTIDQYPEYMEMLDEEDRERYLNDDQTGFDNKEVLKTMKGISAHAKYKEGSLYWCLQRVRHLINQEKAYRKVLRDRLWELHIKTKATIESLTDDQIKEFLRLKWIVPTCLSFNTIPESLLGEFANKVKSLVTKYAVTYKHIEEQLHEEEMTLSDLLCQLRGSDIDMQGINEFKSSIEKGDYSNLIGVASDCISKMLPQDEKKPLLRFSSFDKDWSMSLFKDTFTFLKTNTLARANLTTDVTEVQNVHYGDVLIKYGSTIDLNCSVLPYILDISIADKFGNSLLCDGDIIIADTAEDETVGKCSEIMNVESRKVISGLHTMACRPKFAFAKGYMGYFMNSDSYHKQLLPLMQGTKVLSISKSAIQDTLLKYPVDIEEQKKIASFFLSLDRLISLHHQRLEKMECIKEASLQRMFV